MTMIEKARQNRRIALAVKAEVAQRATLLAPAAPEFRSIRAANLNHAPAAQTSLVDMARHLTAAA